MQKKTDYEIYCGDSVVIKFKGIYREDLEKPNWKYYQDENGDLYHIRKENIVLVIEKNKYEGSE